MFCIGPHRRTLVLSLLVQLVLSAHSSPAHAYPFYHPQNCDNCHRTPTVQLTTPGDGSPSDGFLTFGNNGNVLVGQSSNGTVTLKNTLSVGTAGSGSANTGGGFSGSFPAAPAGTRFGPTTASPFDTGTAAGNPVVYYLTPQQSDSQVYTYTPLQRSLGIFDTTSLLTIVFTNGFAVGSVPTVTFRLRGKGVAPQVSLNTSGANAGNVLVGSSKNATLTVQNVGDGNLSGLGDISNLKGSFAAGSGRFIGTGAAFNLGDSASQSRQYAFTPLSRGLSSVSANVSTTNGSTNGQNQSQVLAAQLSGTGVAPVVSLNTSGVNAGNVLVGSSKNATLTVQNVGDGNLSGLGDVSNLKGSFAAGSGVFAGAMTTFNLGDSESQLQQYSFTPVTRGTVTLDVDVMADNGHSSGSNLPQVLSAQVSGTGVGPVVSLDSTQANAGNVLIGTSGVSKLTVRNVGDGNQSGLGAASNLSGSFAFGTGVFGGGGAGFSLADNASQLQEYSFTPLNRGFATVNANVSAANGSSNGQNQAQVLSVQLSGTGVAPVVRLDATLANAGSVLVGSSGNAALTVQNIGDGNLSGLGDVSNLKGSFVPGSGQFNGTGAAFNLVDNESQMQQYSFTPLNRGTSTLDVDVITINGRSDGTNQGQTLAAQISGKGVAPVVSLDISEASAGNVRVGTSGVSRLTVQNTGDGNQSLQGASSNLIGSFGPGSGAFSGTGAPFSLPDNALQVQEYTFAPVTRGATFVDANVSTSNGSSNGANLAQELPAQLAGTGVGPVFESSIAAGSVIDFGSVSTQSSRPLTIFNNTADPELGALTLLTLLSYDISGPDAGSFSLVNFSQGAQLAKGAGVLLDIGFSVGGGNGVRTAMLSLITDEGAALGGIGDAFSYSLIATTVPEPTVAQMFGAGLICMGMLVLRKRREARRSAYGRPRHGNLHTGG